MNPERYKTGSNEGLGGKTEVKEEDRILSLRRALLSAAQVRRQGSDDMTSSTQAHDDQSLR